MKVSLKPFLLLLCALPVQGTIGLSAQVEHCIVTKCPKGPSQQGICASDGSIYPDECHIKCAGKALKAVSECRTPYDATEAGRCKGECQRSMIAQADYISCTKSCTIDPKITAICAADGKTYLTPCHMKCKNGTLSPLFHCENTSAENCKAKCQERLAYDSCEGRCPKVHDIRKMCASDGRFYQDLCRAKCKDPRNEETLQCGPFSESECKKHCDKRNALSRCESLCQPSPASKSPICADDGNVYDSFCKAQCHDENAKFVFECSARSFCAHSHILCSQACSRAHHCKLNCKNSEQKLIYGPDGAIYHSLCEEHCNTVDFRTQAVSQHPQHTTSGHAVGLNASLGPDTKSHEHQAANHTLIAQSK